MYLKNTLNSISIAKYKLVLQFKQQVSLPSFKGSTFRGGFGYTLKKICCATKNKSCDECIIKSKCVYSILFEAKINNEGYKVLGFVEPPRPFVLEIPNDNKNFYNIGDTLELYILIFGNSIQFFPYIVLTFHELGKIGIGSTKAKYDLVSVETIDGKPIYNSQSQMFYNNGSTIKLSFDDVKEINQIKINFLTPTRIKTNGKYTKDITFKTLIKTILRRLMGLFLFYADKKLECNFNEILNESEKINLISSNLKWVEFERFSTRQKTKMKLGGVVGEVVYEGKITKFYPLLKIGEYIHIGKNTTFGFGEYEIVS